MAFGAIRKKGGCERLTASALSIYDLIDLPHDLIDFSLDLRSSCHD